MNPVSTVPVSQALYHAACCPDLDKPVTFHAGKCGSCHRHTDVTPAGDILTDRFGSWDVIRPDPDTHQRHLCCPCAWAYRTKDLRHRATVIDASGMRHPSGTELRQVLSRPIAADTAVIVPVTGKKSIAARAMWGMLTSDSGPLTWNRSLARHTRTLSALKAAGVPEWALVEPSPPARVVDALTGDEWTQVHRMWTSLDAVRGDRLIFPLLIKLTRKVV